MFQYNISSKKGLYLSILDKNVYRNRIYINYYKMIQAARIIGTGLATTGLIGAGCFLSPLGDKELM